ncbi:MAG TPA: AI-2E family transporter [Desulfobacteraceae bacterium]|nr:AI-2E family transporter [Desulfobacteraceae bacterium]
MKGAEPPGDENDGGAVGQSSSERAVFFFFLFLFFISLLFTVRLITPFFATITLGILCTGLFTPPYRWVARRVRPGIASAVTCLIIFFAVFVPVLFFVGVLSKEAYDLYLMAKGAVLSNQLRELLENTQALDRVNSLLSTMGITVSLSWEELIQPVSEIGKMVGLALFQQASFIASNVLKIVFYFCLMLIVVFYMLMDGPRFVNYVFDLSPLPREYNVKLFEKFRNMAGAVLVGNGVGGLIQGVSGGVVFFVFGLGAPFLWGVIMGFLAFLPIVGVGIVLIPAGIILMLKQQMAAGIFVFLFYTVLSWSVEYIVKPKIVGNRANLHPLVVFFAIIGGLKLYGILGIVYGPLIVTFFLTLADIYFMNYQLMVEPDSKTSLNKQ